MSLRIHSAGPLVSLQDAGRFGLRRYGVSHAGPMDRPAHALANALCGNATDAAALEFAGTGGVFSCDRPCRFAVTGGACDIRRDGTRLAAGESHRLEPGQRLHVGALSGAVWGYLAVSGGIETPPVLGARATHLRAGLGGLDGRRLQAGDRLPLGPEAETTECLRPATPLPNANLPHATGPIRIVLGPQEDAFDAAILNRLQEAVFTISAQRDRMAMVLDGPPLPAATGHDIVSDGTVPGAIQVPGSGQPIVLMAECQTTGGYPKIATVITADLPRLAQMATGADIRLEAIDRDTAEDIAIAHHAAIAALLGGLVAKPADLLSSRYLLSCDLVGGVFDPAQIVRDGPKA